MRAIPSRTGLHTAALLLLLAGGAVRVDADSSGADSSGARQSHVVTIENMKFEPATLKVKRGDVVVWSNKDLFPHTATADGKAFDSGGLDPGKRWQYVARTRGEYAYSCTFHPTMKATLIVE
jgi:plastocyanin